MTTLICQLCGSETIRRGAMQKYCPKCSEKKSKERGRVWAKNNPPSHEVVKRARSKQIIRQKENAVRLANHTSNIVEYREIDDLDFMHCVKVKIPFDYGFSKNAIFTLNCKSKGHLYMREEAKALRNGLSYAIKNALQKGDLNKFYQGKVYLDIFVEKPNHKGDAINVLDAVCDAVKDAIGVDDRWYCIRRLDWKIVKHGQAFMTVGIYQEITEDHGVCHRCGRIFPLSCIISRVCKECRSPSKRIGNPPGVAVIVDEFGGDE